MKRNSHTILLRILSFLGMLAGVVVASFTLSDWREQLGLLSAGVTIDIISIKLDSRRKSSKLGRILERSAREHAVSRLC